MVGRPERLPHQFVKNSLPEAQGRVNEAAVVPLPACASEGARKPVFQPARKTSASLGRKRRPTDGLKSPPKSE